MTRLTLDTDALARLRVRTGRTEKSLSPVRYRLDSEGTPISVDLPGPAYLSNLLALVGIDALQQGRTIVTRPVGSEERPLPIDHAELANDLREILAALPDRPDAQIPYRDLRRASSMPSPTFEKYLRDVVRAFREDLPTYRAPVRTRAPSGPPKSEAQRSSERRALWREDEEASVARWLDIWLDPDDPPAPGRHLVKALHMLAEETIFSWQGEERTLSNGRDVVPPGARVFAQLLDTRLGPRTRTKQGNVYTLPEARMAPMLTREQILAEIARQERDAIAHDAVSTGTDGVSNVVRLRSVAR